MSDPIDDSRVQLVCMPVQPGLRIAAGSTMRRCSSCGGQIWVSPSSWDLVVKKALARGTMPILLCMACAAEHVPPGCEIGEFTPEQIEEVAREIQKDP